MTGRQRLAGLATALAIALPAAAQDADPAAAVEAPSDAPMACELHIWPAAGLRFSDQGMWDNFKSGLSGGILGELDRPERRLERSKRDGTDSLPENPAELLDPVDQRVLFATVPDGAQLGLPGHRLIVHDAALSSRDIRNTPGRHAPDAAPCYAELILDTLVFSNEWGNGQNLKSLYRFRDFGTAGAPARSFGAWVQTKLVIEPEQLPQKFDEARAEMRAAFTNNVALFGAALTTNATKQGKTK